MIDEIAMAFGALLPVSQVRVDGSAIRAVVRSGDAWFATRVRSEPFAELFVTTRALDGFELSIAWGDRWRDPDVGDAEFDRAFGLATNDPMLMRLWLDEPARTALQQSVYEYRVSDVSFSEGLGLAPEHPFSRPPRMAKRTWTYELGNDELVAFKGSVENDPARLATAVSTGCAIAARSQRWAAEYGELARSLGGAARSELELGGPPILTATRHTVELSVHVLRRLDRAEDRLRTLVRAPRQSTTRDTLSLLATDLPKSARPPLPDGDSLGVKLGFRLRASGDHAIANKLDDTAGNLLQLALPGAIAIDQDSVDLWFDGAPMERERLDAALELVARWAIDSTVADGPYR